MITTVKSIFVTTKNSEGHKEAQGKLPLSPPRSSKLAIGRSAAKSAKRKEKKQCGPVPFLAWAKPAVSVRRHIAHTHIPIYPSAW